jgi:hypothetical protein
VVRWYTQRNPNSDLRDAHFQRVALRLSLGKLPSFDAPSITASVFLRAISADRTGFAPDRDARRWSVFTENERPRNIGAITSRHYRLPSHKAPRELSFVKRHVKEGHTMWEHYRNTFLRIQTVVFVATLIIFFALGRRWFVAVTFFSMMQVGSVVGAWWGQRLKRRLGPLFH